MAGVKGRSGGPRPNSGGARPNSGGARPGAGRKPNPNAASHKVKPVKIDADDEEVFVYVIYETEDPGICKIGVATDLIRRLYSMQVGTWRVLKIGHAAKLPSKSAAHAIERQVHQSLGALHVRGEWFRVSPDRAAAEVNLAVSQLQAAFDAVASQNMVRHGD